MKKTLFFLLSSALFTGLVLVQAPAISAASSKSKSKTKDATATATTTTETSTSASKKKKSSSSSDKILAKTADKKGSATQAAKKVAPVPAQAPVKPSAPTPAASPAPAAHTSAHAAKTPPPNAGDIAGAKARGLVWLNLNTKVYHNSGDKEYGTTKSGKFVTEAEAKAAGAKLAAR